MLGLLRCSSLQRESSYNDAAALLESEYGVPRGVWQGEKDEPGAALLLALVHERVGGKPAVAGDWDNSEPQPYVETPRGAPSSGAPEATAAPAETGDAAPSLPRAKSSGSRFKAAPLIKCVACGKTVYATEKIMIEEQPYHKTCLKCTKVSLLSNEEYPLFYFVFENIVATYVDLFFFSATRR